MSKEYESVPDPSFDPAQSLGAQPWWKIMHYLIIIHPAYDVVVWMLRIYCVLAGIALPFLLFWG